MLFHALMAPWPSLLRTPGEEVLCFMFTAKSSTGCQRKIKRLRELAVVVVVGVKEHIGYITSEAPTRGYWRSLKLHGEYLLPPALDLNKWDGKPSRFGHRLHYVSTWIYTFFSLIDENVLWNKWNKAHLGVKCYTSFSMSLQILSAAPVSSSAQWSTSGFSLFITSQIKASVKTEDVGLFYLSSQIRHQFCPSVGSGLKIAAPQISKKHGASQPPVLAMK